MTNAQSQSQNAPTEHGNSRSCYIFINSVPRAAMSDAKIQGPTGSDHRASMAVHTLQDGRSILAWSKPPDDTHVVAIYSETDARGHRGRSQVFVWEIDPLTKAGRVAAQGPALEKLYKTTSVATGAVLPAAHAISCGPGTYVCSYCVSFDGGFTDCCGPCGFAFLGGLVSGLSCVLIWCTWCVWEHCASFAESCAPRSDALARAEVLSEGSVLSWSLDQRPL